MGTGKEESKTSGRVKVTLQFSHPFNNGSRKLIWEDLENIFPVSTLQTVQLSSTESVMRCHGQVADGGNQYWQMLGKAEHLSVLLKQMRLAGCW